MSSRQSIKQGVIALLTAAAFPSIACAQLTEEQEVLLASGLTAGSLMTACVMLEEGMLSREDIRLYAIGYIASIRKSETGAGLAGAMMGLERVRTITLSARYPTDNDSDPPLKAWAASGLIH